MNPDWIAMLRSVEKRRDTDARFFKPTALLAVIDGIADGSLSPSDIDPYRVVKRFDAYLAEILPARASSGWRPFWHLTRDGAWTFTREGRVVGPEDFGKQRKPNSRRELMAKIDHVFVPPALRGYWRDPRARGELRKAVIAMLAADDVDSRLVAAHLATDEAPFAASRAAAVQPDASPGERRAGLGSGRPNSRGQGFAGSPLARKAVENCAMDIARAALEHDGWRYA